MNPQDTDPTLLPGAPAADDTPAAPKPRRRRAAAVAAADEAPPVETGGAEDAGEAAPKPKRPRRKPAEAEAQTMAPPAAEVPAPPAIEASVAAVEPLAAAAGDAPAAAAGEASADNPDRENRGRRNRNRRRNRRGDRTDRPLGADAGVAAAVSSVDDDDDEADSEPRPPLPTLPAGDINETFADVLSGAYDALPVQEPEAGVPERRILAPEPDAPKLHKVLAQAGIGSRRDMEALIQEGRVTVNNQPAHTGQRISWGDQIKVGGKPIKVRISPPPPRVLAYHKPAGEVVTNDDPQHRPTVFRKLPRLHQGKWQSVGRLDINTEGLLLFTNSGDLANQLMHPRFGVEREYAVRVLGTLDADMRDELLEGVDVEGQMCAFKSIEDGGGEGVNHWYRVVITEGRNREVRKLFASVDLAVSRLIRIRYGGVVLPRGLKRGVWVDLSEADVRTLRQMAGGGRNEGRGDLRNDSRHDGPRPPREGQRDGRRGGGGRGEAAPRREPGGEGGPIPNPLQQTFDKRAIREAGRPKREYAEDGPIPNPLEQTYDKRHVQKQNPFGGGNRKRSGGGGEGGSGGQPDPMKTTLGYIGADAFVRKFQQTHGPRGRKRSGGGGGGGGGGGR